MENERTLHVVPPCIPLFYIEFSRSEIRSAFRPAREDGMTSIVQRGLRPVMFGTETAMGQGTLRIATEVCPRKLKG